MGNNKYTAPNDFRAFCEMLGETENSISHHGIKGQHWGIRRFQDETGKLTFKGKLRYYDNKTGKKTNAEADLHDSISLGEAKKRIKEAKKDPQFKGLLKTAKNLLKTGDTQTALDSVINITKIKPTKNDLDKILNAAYPSRYDGKKMGCSSDVVLDRTFPNYEKPAKSFARYSTSVKNKDGDVKITIDVPLNNNKINDINESIKTAKHVATDKVFIKELKTKKELLLNDTDEKNADSLMKTGYISWVDVNKDGATGSYGLRGYKTNGDKEYMEGRFITTPNGKIIPLDPYITDPD